MTTLLPNLTGVGLAFPFHVESALHPWLAWTCLAAVVIGCQALVSSAIPRQRVVVMLPSSPDDSVLRDRFLQGFAIGEGSVRACGYPLPTVRWMSLRPDQSPLEQLTHHSDQHLVVAPPSADLRAFSALSKHHGISVLLPYQRGESIDTLRGLKGRDKLWPLVPSVEDDIKATVEATLKAGWDRAMVVADPNSLEAILSKKLREKTISAAEAAAFRRAAAEPAEVRVPRGAEITARPAVFDRVVQLRRRQVENTRSGQPGSQWGFSLRVRVRGGPPGRYAAVGSRARRAVAPGSRYHARGCPRAAHCHVRSGDPVS